MYLCGGKLYSKILDISENKYSRLVKKYKEIGLQAKPNKKWISHQRETAQIRKFPENCWPTTRLSTIPKQLRKIRRGHGIYLEDSFSSKSAERVFILAAT